MGQNTPGDSLRPWRTSRIFAVPTNPFVLFRASIALVLLALVACTKPAAGPTITGISPDRGPADRDVAVTISGTGLAPMLITDFSRGSESTLDTTVTARLGDSPLTAVKLNTDGTIAATVPAGLAPGSYDLTVVAPGGSPMTMAGAYRVLAANELGDLVASYRFDPIAPQQVGNPFTVTITALDSTSTPIDGYSGEATLSDTTGTVVPLAIGPFAGGVWNGLVEVRSVTSADVLTVTDARSIKGSSNTFAVTAGNGTRLVFTTPPRSALAGACSSAVTVQRVDATSAPSPATAPIPLTLTASPASGFTLYSDATCATALTAPTIALGQTSATLFFRGTHAGSVQLAAAAPGHTTAVQLETVSPGAPQKIVFVTADPTLNSGTCSSPITLQSRDSFDNPSPVAADTATALVVAPSGGLSLFASDGCVTPITGLMR